MGLTSAFIFALDGAGLGDKCAVITDGQMSGLVNKGIVVGEVSPEAATGGPLGLVRNGDIITIDLDKRVLDFEVPADEGQTRAAPPSTVRMVPVAKPSVMRNRKARAMSSTSPTRPTGILSAVLR